MNYSVAKIATIIKGKFLTGRDIAGSIEHLLLDSRKLLFPGSTIFFALSSPRRSGNSFIGDLYLKGVRCFVVDGSFDTNNLEYFQDADFLLVDNVLAALQGFAAYHRSRFDIPVIGITGSNGKTIIKEWLFQLLADDFSIVRSPRSYNSQVGVPLSICQVNESHTLGIFEAGISVPGEMERLEKVIQPQVGVFTNIGEAHSEGFLNTSQKIREKFRLFDHTASLICGLDDQEVNSVLYEYGKLNQRLFTWGASPQATLRIISVEKLGDHATIKAVDTRLQQPEPVSITIPFSDDASIQNAITCWAVLLHLGIDQALVSKRMLQLRPVEMRLELKQGINHCSVINDSYSADINSLTMALDFLVQQQQHPTRTVILSDILQSGKSGEALYREVSAILQQKKVDRFIGVGPELSRYKDHFSTIPHVQFFSSLAECLQHFYSLHFYNETILLKGARVFEFEQIGHLLEEKVHQTVLDINLNAVTHNLGAYQQVLNKGVKLMAMVKAFSYGSGGFEIANLLQFQKVDWLAVAYADEGVELRKAGIGLPILVLNPEQATFDVMVQHDLEPELYSFAIFQSFQQYLERSGVTNYPVHVKLDTGMHRLGFEIKELGELGRLLKAHNIFKVQSVFSHLAASDAPEHDDFTRLQANRFLKGCAELQASLDYTFIRHIANTSSIYRHPELQLDMVRLGIGLYGVDNNAEMQSKLKNVSTLKTTISQIKQVSAGESVGYSRKGIVSRDSTIATVRIGYADGYPRILSNGAGKMWVNGSLVPVIGNVCMDMTMLDITGKDIREGDEVIVFGEPLPVYQLASWAQTIPYEILTGISQRVRRVYFEE